MLVTADSADSRIATCFAWLPSRYKHQLTPQDAWRMGETLGCLHHMNSTYQLPAGLARWDFDREAFATMATLSASDSRSTLDKPAYDSVLPYGCADTSASLCEVV
jgi:hypothetical protein